jgi:hypothetical protein
VQSVLNDLTLFDVGAFVKRAALLKSKRLLYRRQLLGPSCKPELQARDQRSNLFELFHFLGFQPAQFRGLILQNLDSLEGTRRRRFQ